MKGFRYVAIGITIIIILISLLVPFFMGRVMKSQFTSELKEQQFPKNVNIKLISYHAGWFYSHAKIAVQVKLIPDDAAKHMDFPMKELAYQTDLRIINSPFVQLHLVNNETQFFIGGGVAEGQLMLSTNGNKLLQQIEGFTKPWQVYLGVGARGKMIFYMSHGPVKYMDKKYGGIIQVSNMHVLAHAHSFGRWQGDFGLHNISASFLGNVLNIDSAVIKFNARKGASGFWTGSNTFNIPTVDLALNAKPVLTMKHFYITSSNGVNDNKLSVTQRLGFRSLQVYGFKQGPCSIENDYRNISFPAIKNISDLVKEQQKTNKVPFEKVSHALLQAALNLRVTSAMRCNGDFGNYTMQALFQGPAFLPTQHTAESHLKQYFDLSTGDLKFQVRLTTLADSEAMMQRIKAVKDDPYAQKFYETLMALPFFLNTYTQQGYFVKKGTRFTSDFTLRNGIIYLNKQRLYPSPKPDVNANGNTKQQQAGDHLQLTTVPGQNATN